MYYLLKVIFDNVTLLKKYSLVLEIYVETLKIG